jgi:hypothetical protein
MIQKNRRRRGALHCRHQDYDLNPTHCRRPSPLLRPPPQHDPKLKNNHDLRPKTLSPLPCLVLSGRHDTTSRHPRPALRPPPRHRPQQDLMASSSTVPLGDMLGAPPERSSRAPTSSSGRHWCSPPSAVPWLWVSLKALTVHLRNSFHPRTPMARISPSPTLPMLHGWRATRQS